MTPISKTSGWFKSKMAAGGHFEKNSNNRISATRHSIHFMDVRPLDTIGLHHCWHIWRGDWRLISQGMDQTWGWDRQYNISCLTFMSVTRCLLLLK